MGNKYIIELEDKPFHNEDGDSLCRVKGFNSLVFDMTGISKLAHYHEPDLEQVKKEAYADGYNTGFGRKIDASYQEGLSDAWEAAKKIALDKEDGGLDTVAYCEIFGYGKGFGTILKKFSASEAIEKIRQYEQEEDRQARIEFNCEEIKDVLNTTVKECNVSLDEIATVLEKMRGEQDG